VFIEGKVGRFAGLAFLPPLNFAIGQLGLLLQLCGLVRGSKISVVRAGDPLLLGLYGWTIARLSRIPLVIRVGGNNEKVRRETGKPMMPRLLRSRRLERAIERFVLSRADLVGAANEDNRRYAVEMGARDEATTLFRYGNLIDPIHFSDPALREGAPERLDELGLAGRSFLLYIGRLEPVKMPDHVVRTLAGVRAAGFDASLLVVGAGSMQKALEALARELSIEDHVKFAGERDQAWLASVIPRASVVVSPHTGRALAEAALGGAPTVAYDIDWQGELIESGVSGELVACGNVGAMTDAVAGLLGNPARAALLGARLRQMALVMLDPQRLDQHERSAYDRILQPSR
jgi:glycosyltransferase involved in cell wall biosynthesis